MSLRWHPTSRPVSANGGGTRESRRARSRGVTALLKWARNPNVQMVTLVAARHQVKHMSGICREPPRSTGAATPYSHGLNNLVIRFDLTGATTVVHDGLAQGHLSILD